MMGFQVSKTRNENSEELRRLHKNAEKLIAEDLKKSEKIFKLLLLGPGDSGKSTIVKQMRILHANGFSSEEMQQQRFLIIGNVVHAIATIIRAMREFGIKFDSELREADAFQVMNIEKYWSENPALTINDWQCLQRMWKDGGVQACFARSNEYQIPDSTKYFCDSMDRLSAVNYTPDQQDMLRSRASTMGIVEIEFTLRGLTLKVIDVGGQRSQRKKWIHCFENINGLIYVAAISEYNQVLQEDSKVNRLYETVKLFSMIINSRWFVETSVVLFLNKKDIFEEKLKIYPLSMVFPKYTGGDNFEKACTYIEYRFKREKRNADKDIYVHRTCATDTRNVEFVLDSCFDILLKGSLTRSGLV